MAGGQLGSWRLLQCLCACPYANRIRPSLDSDSMQESKVKKSFENNDLGIIEFF